MAFEFKALANNEVDLSITGVIGDDFWSDEPCTADMVRDALRKAPNAALVRAFVDTDGGDVWHGFGIYQALVEHPARVVVSVGARAQSCGSLILMAGDEIVMPETSKILVHNPWTRIEGDANRLEKRVVDLRNLEDSFVTAYSSRTGMSDKAVRDLMGEDRLMSASEALSLGFCTEIKKSKTKTRAMSDDQLRANVTLLQVKAQMKASAMRAAALGVHKQPVMSGVSTEQSSEGPEQDTSVAIACTRASLLLKSKLSAAGL